MSKDIIDIALCGSVFTLNRVTVQNQRRSKCDVWWMTFVSDYILLACLIKLVRISISDTRKGPQNLKHRALEGTPWCLLSFNITSK